MYDAWLRSKVITAQNYVTTVHPLNLDFEPPAEVDRHHQHILHISRVFLPTHCVVRQSFFIMLRCTAHSAFPDGVTATDLTTYRTTLNNDRKYNNFNL